MENNWINLIPRNRKERQNRIEVVITLFILVENTDWRTTMNTLTLKRKAKTFDSKKILLTLKKGSGHYPMSAVIAPMKKDLEVEITNKKMMTIPSKNGHDRFLEGRLDLEKIDIHNCLRPRLTQVPVSTGKSLLITEKCSVVDKLLASKSAFSKELRKILSNRKKDEGLKNEESLEQATLNKQDRFVPNILRNTKAAENSLNNNSSIGFNITHTAITPEIDEHCKDYKNVKRKRKQVLGSSLNIERDPPCNAQVLREESNRNKSILRSCETVEIETEIQILETTVTESEKENYKKCPEISTTAQQLTMDTGDSKDLHSADPNIPYKTENLPIAEEMCVNCNDDRSIDKIFAEFEVADYKNYIDREDLGLDINEMDKLLNSEIEGSPMNSLIFDDGTKIVGYDMNGNNIENHGNLFKNLTDDNKLNARNSQCKIEPCYGDRAETKINPSKRHRYDINADDICSKAWDGRRRYERSESNLWSNEYEDYHPNDDFQDFLCSADRDSSSTDTASESETNDLNSTRTSSLISPKNNLLVVSDMVPDNFFSNESNESCSDGFGSNDYTFKCSSSLNPLMQQYDPSSNDGNENKYCPPPSDMPLETFAKKLVFYNDVDANLEIFEDGNFLEDNTLKTECAFSKEDETCATILANSNAKFYDKDLSSTYSDVADIDIENADDIEISRLLKLDNVRVNDFTSVSNFTLQPYGINAFKNELSADLTNRSNANNMLTSNQDNSQFGTMNFENLPHAQDKNKTNESICLEDVEYSFSTKVETGLQDCYPTNQEFNYSNSVLANGSFDCDEPCDEKIKNIDCTISSSQCSSVLPIEGRNMTGWKSSKLESLLTRTGTYADYSNTRYWLEISGDVGTDSRMTRIGNCSKIEGYSDVRILNSATPSRKSCDSRQADCKNIGNILDLNVAQKRNCISEASVITINDDADDYSVAERRNHCPLKSELTHNQDLYNSQSITCSASSYTPPSSGKLPNNLTKPKGGIWKDLVKRSKFVAQYINSCIPCDLCKNKYSSQAALADHIKLSHRHRPSQFRLKDKKFICDKCSKEYMFAPAIQKHFKLHENYSLTCRICEKHFSEKAFLRRHVYNIHSSFQLECTYCSHKFAKKSTLSRHIKKYHGLEDFCGESIV